MEDIAHLVSASLARHGFVTQVDHRRLQWSKWYRCDSTFSVLTAPSKPGLLALAEEPADKPEFGSGCVSGFAPGLVSGHRFSDPVTAESVAHLAAEAVPLALLQVSETEDLSMALCRLFFPVSPEQARLSKKTCYLRYTVIEDADQRLSAYRSLQEWMASPSESGGGMPNNLAVHNFAGTDQPVVETDEDAPWARTGT
jgi:hypothetical protein